jgi:hypothetical protein
MMRREEQKVLTEITIIPQGISLGEHTVLQVHPLLGSIKGGLGWMRYKDK